MENKGIGDGRIKRLNAQHPIMLGASYTRREIACLIGWAGVPGGGPSTEKMPGRSQQGLPQHSGGARGREARACGCRLLPKNLLKNR